MRCSCKQCGTYMIQAESDHLGCICPDCGKRIKTRIYERLQLPENVYFFERI